MLIKRIARAIIAIMIVGGGTVAIGAQPASANNGPLNSSHRAAIIGKASGRCLDVKNGDTVGNGARLQLWDCNGSYNQGFSNQSIYKIQTRKWYDKCLDVVDGNPNDGARIQQYDCNYNAQQDFSFVFVYNDGVHDLYQVKTTFGKCLDATNYGTANGTPIQQYYCFPSHPAQQLWWVR
ncbi:hypothetical protein GCM10010168_64080 [Actinoplanes ianthinogenes]|uniref:Ricin B lectin domain-containing protein n=1 Tax=Actinoplanes ianthinogenes TaxID=122358 RepID=A0ABM7LJA4_9ACTN|nr:RICIN domain-containing protein [Actinoplanes ianthinogenes]BCJ39344.1 hypothetical protein Aiant_00010 [Actinoplanes ianthinogenes]GGR36761.1 hypothetical protein GCM10010168_64080 [Actinoplanes ianthinogenes]